MKKSTKTNEPRHARVAVLTPQKLASVIGGTGGIIVVENLAPTTQGIQGTGKV